MKDKKKFSDTKELLIMARNSPNVLERLLVKGDFIEQTSLPEYLQSLLSKYSLSISDIVRSSLLSKSYVYQIFNGERIPSRDVLLRIGLSISCSIDEMQHLLILAQVAPLYPKVKRDAAILCCISKGFTIEETNDFLEYIDIKALL